MGFSTISEEMLVNVDQKIDPYILGFNGSSQKKKLGHHSHIKPDI